MIPLSYAKAVKSLNNFSRLEIISGNNSLIFCEFKGSSLTPFVVGVKIGVSNLCHCFKPEA